MFILKLFQELIEEGNVPAPPPVELLLGRLISKLELGATFFGP